MPNRTGARTVSTSGGNQPTSIGITSNDLIQLENRLKIEFEQKIQQQQSKSLDILAIFITLFTFISVNVTIFQKVDNEKAVYFMLLITGAMIALVGTLFLISEFSKQRLYIMLSGILIVLLMPFLWGIINLIWNYSVSVLTLEKHEISTPIGQKNDHIISTILVSGAVSVSGELKK